MRVTSFMLPVYFPTNPEVTTLEPLWVLEMIMGYVGRPRQSCTLLIKIVRECMGIGVITVANQFQESVLFEHELVETSHDSEYCTVCEDTRLHELSLMHTASCAL